MNGESALDIHAPVAWPAIIAGAVASVATAFVLIAIGTGFDLALGSPWPGGRLSGEGFNPMAGAGLVAVQSLAAALGGYLAGRLRPHWAGVHGHEVHFRDTAHGFLAWALSVVAGVVLAAVWVAAAGRPAEMAIGDDPLRAAHLASQASLFMGIGLLMAAFVASVAGAIGGLRRDEMRLRGPAAQNL